MPSNKPLESYLAYSPSEGDPALSNLASHVDAEEMFESGKLP